MTATEATTAELVVPALRDMRPRAVAAPAASSPSTQKTLAFVAGGVGLVALGVTAVAGAVSMSHRSKAESACPVDRYDYRCPTEDGASEWNSATSAGNVATIAAIVGGVGVASGVVLWLTAPKGQTRTGVAPGRLVVEGSF